MTDFAAELFSKFVLQASVSCWNSQSDENFGEVIRTEAMARKRKRRRGFRRKQVNRKQRLQSAGSWLEKYEGNEEVHDYRRRYGVTWEVAFAELKMLGVLVDPVLLTADAVVAVHVFKQWAVRSNLNG